MALDFLTWEGIEPGRVDVVSPLIRRVTATNAGPFTYTGTGTYVVGTGEVAIIDPGPDDAAHVEALLAAVAGETVTHLVVTHTHRDHSPAARALAAETGASIVGAAPHPADDHEDVTARDDRDDDGERDGEPREEPGDHRHRADVELGHGDIVEGSGWRLETVATPGHLPNHLCFALPDEAVLFTGDHIMGWSTSVIPAAGDLRDYLRSLELVARRADARHLPTHGPPIDDPVTWTEALIEHRRARERQIVDRLRAGASTVPEIVAALYVGLDERLVKAAGASVRSHLGALITEGTVTADGEDLTADGRVFRLV